MYKKKRKNVNKLRVLKEPGWFQQKGLKIKVSDGEERMAMSLSNCFEVLSGTESDRAMKGGREQLAVYYTI